MTQTTVRTTLLLFILVLFAIPLVACGEDSTASATEGTSEVAEAAATDPVEDPTPEPTSTNTPVPPTNTPEPTHTPDPTDTPSPTDTPAPTDTPEPTALDPAVGFVSFESGPGGFRVNHPEEWIVEDLLGLVIFGTSEGVLLVEQPTGDVAAFSIISFPAADYEAQFGTRDPVVIIEEGVQQLVFDSEIVEGPTATTTDGIDAATAIINNTDSDGESFITYQLVLIGEDRAVSATGTTSTEYADQYIPIFEAMASSIELVEPTVTLLDQNEGTLHSDLTLTGTVDVSGPSIWRLVGFPGDVVSLYVESQTDTLDVVVDITGETGESILPNGAVDEYFDIEEIIEVELPYLGEYFVIVSGFNGSVGEYEITLYSEDS